jgi:anti-anti-sigma factor
VPEEVARSGRRRKDRGVPTPPLRIDEHDAGAVHVLALAGELDLRSAPVLAARVDSARNDGVRKILVDLTDVAFCDSTGLRALIGAASELRIAGGRLTVACPGGGPVARLLDLTGTREALSVYDDVDRATASLSR